jgi:hypothetical protein
MQPIQDFFVKVDKKLNDEILLNGGLKLFLDPTWRHEWNVTVTGTVYGIPEKYKKHYPTLKVNDEVAFAYTVVNERRFKSGAENFVQITEDNQYYKRFQNPSGEKIIVSAIPGKISLLWVGVYLDKYNNRIDGLQGTESEVGRWLSQFNMGGVQDGYYKNLLATEQGDFWKVKPAELLAKKEGDEITMYANRVLAKPIEIDYTTKYNLENGTILPAFSIVGTYMDRAELVSGGEDLGLKKGDIISTNEEYAEQYDLWGTKYFIIKKNRINGVHI